jgi:serine/threonine protein phosphatase 1
MIKRLGPNLAGRDFVCGDIHGCYERLEAFLNDKQIGFDKRIDRLIGCGDIIDRGSRNEECLDLLYEPWFDTVMGNHEFMMMDYFRGGEYSETWINNGGAWGQQYMHDFSDQAVRIRDTVHLMVSNLPSLITVDLANGKKFHVIHAEFFSQNEITDDHLSTPQLFNEVTMERNLDGICVLWGRKIFGSIRYEHLDDRIVNKFRRRLELELKHVAKMYGGDKLSNIYSGHTVVRRPVRVFNHTNLDTSAYGSYDYHGRHGLEKAAPWAGLTVTEPLTDRFWLVNDAGVKEVQPLII